jgi:hypothetical protein
MPQAHAGEEADDAEGKGDEPPLPRAQGEDPRH